MTLKVSPNYKIYVFSSVNQKFEYLNCFSEINFIRQIVSQLKNYDHDLDKMKNGKSGLKVKVHSINTQVKKSDSPDTTKAIGDTFNRKGEEGVGVYACVWVRVGVSNDVSWASDSYQKR